MAHVISIKLNALDTQRWYTYAEQQGIPLNQMVRSTVEAAIQGRPSGDGIPKTPRVDLPRIDLSGEGRPLQDWCPALDLEVTDGDKVGTVWGVTKRGVHVKTREEGDSPSVILTLDSETLKLA